MVDFCGLARPENHFALLRSLLRSGVGDASTPNNSIDIKKTGAFLRQQALEYICVRPRFGQHSFFGPRAFSGFDQRIADARIE
jgi:hypothetical protein